MRLLDHYRYYALFSVNNNQILLFFASNDQKISANGERNNLDSRFFEAKTNKFVISFFTRQF